MELGGEFRGQGQRRDGRGWRIGVEDPRQVSKCYATVLLDNAALATSGDYRQAVLHQGNWYSHIIDPRTGRPIQHNGTAVSVIAPDAFTADGWSTALLVLGPGAGRELAEREKIAASFIRRVPPESPPEFTSAVTAQFVVSDASLSDRIESSPGWKLWSWGLIFIAVVGGVACRRFSRRLSNV